MKTTHILAALVLPTCLVAPASAQVQIPINPKATYLRTDSDPGALPSPAIPLSAIGAVPGQWLSIATAGAYSDGSSGDTKKDLLCVFSSNPTLLTNAPGLVNRVPGAITAGASFVSGNTYYGSMSTDLAADFVVARTNWTNGGQVRVPAGAAYVFFSVYDSTNNWTYFSNNVDPNMDYFAVFTAGNPATLPGTGEHPQLRTGVSGTPTATPDVKPANAFSTVSVEVAQRWGASTGELFIVGANIFPTGGAPPVGPLPDFYMGSGFVLVQVGVMTAAPGLWSFFVPPGNAGTTVILQGFFLTNTARNGLLSASDAHRIELL
ncbi:MAG: hypothetical protein ABIP94_20815 [Planctomycetota bacterium]